MLDHSLLRPLAVTLLLVLSSHTSLARAESNPGQVPAAAAQASDPITTAEKQLFLDKHFANTTQKTIDYAYRQSGPSMETVNDTVKVDVRERHPDGTASVDVNFLSGSNHTPIAP